MGQEEDEDCDTDLNSEQSFSQPSESTGHFQHLLILQEETPPQGSAEGTRNLALGSQE